MKDFLLGVVVGIILATTGIYAELKHKAKAFVESEKAQNFTENVRSAFEE